ncbi:hypothetical protein F5Y02DRAFT_427951 [Annulohypoxylon stygium]|nr:hypothetical protein F5Y02DRAFT_427951 [Annulohypoxylon stygium]
MRFSALVVVAAAFGCAVRADWLRWSDGGDGQVTAIPRETVTLSSYSPDGWTPKPTVAPDAIQPEAGRVLEVLKREVSTSSWINEKTCGWIAGAQSSSFGCGENATCVTNANHIVACATGTYSPFYSMCLDYDAYTSGSCKNEDSSTGCCMDSAYPACVTYQWIEPPHRSMYRCWKTPTIITMLDKPEEIEDHPTQSATSTFPPLMDGSSNQKQGGSEPPLGAFVGVAILMIIIAVIGGFILARTLKRCRENGAGETFANMRANFYDRFNLRPGNVHRSNGQTNDGVPRTPVTGRLRRTREEAAERETTNAHPIINRNLAQLINVFTPSRPSVHVRATRTGGATHVDHVEPTSSTGAMHGSEGQASPDPPSYAMHTRAQGQSRQRAPGGTFAEVSDEPPTASNTQSATETDMPQRPETPPPTYQPSILSTSTLGNFVPVNSNATFTNAYGGTENWIELSRSSPTLPAATRRGTMWYPDMASIPASSTWQDMSGSQLSHDAEDVIAPAPSQPPHAPRPAKATLAVPKEDDAVSEEQPRRRRQ